MGSRTRIRRRDALEYHSSGRPGKIEVIPTKPVATQRDLSLAYTPGVAEPCLDIAKDPELSYRYTARGNLVAVVSNGTAVLGLGDLGPAAGKPVMEGKGVLFKKFADIDVFDIEIDAREVDDVVRVVKALEPTFGGINLEDIKAPECFEIEERLKKEMSIPVFHDDQHGTAIISGAALLNAAELAGKRIADLKVVVSGAGASAIACTRFYLSLGVRRENVVLVDTKGVVYEGRTEGMNKYKAQFAAPTKRRTLAEAMEGCDLFLGCSAKGLVDQAMIRSMAERPIVFALANPDPEISYPEAVEARDDIIMATGRSDYPNQVNNVLGFPFIFRGALDVRARAITENMKLAAARALAALAREEVPETVLRAYGGKRKFGFGPTYIIPTPFDPRVLWWVAPAVAKAAMDEGVAGVPIDLDGYVERLKRSQSRSHGVMAGVMEKARKQPVRLVFPEGNTVKVLQAAGILVEEGICQPILLGPEKAIRAMIAEQKLDELDGVPIIDPTEAPDFEHQVEAYWKVRQRRGVSLREARKIVRTRVGYGTMLVAEGKADGMVVGHTMSYPEAVRIPLQVVRTFEGRTAAGVYVVVGKRDFKFFADCTVNAEPTAEQLADIAERTADLARYFDVEPRIAMLSYGNFGSSATPGAKVARATALLKEKRPDLVVDGEMQIDAALDPDLLAESFPFSTLDDVANVLIFPNLDAGNIGYKLMARMGGAEIVGPILLGMNKAVNVLQLGASVSDIVNLAAITVLKAQGEDFKF